MFADAGKWQFHLRLNGDCRDVRIAVSGIKIRLSMVVFPVSIMPRTTTFLLFSPLISLSRAPIFTSFNLGSVREFLRDIQKANPYLGVRHQFHNHLRRIR